MVDQASWLDGQIYQTLSTGLSSLRLTFLLAVRLYWGWQFAQTGWGKLHHLTKITESFNSLNIPFPAFNAHFDGLCSFLAPGRAVRGHFDTMNKRCLHKGAKLT
jgi:hypothetical protein